jgi:hypothetical protein
VIRQKQKTYQNLAGVRTNPIPAVDVGISLCRQRKPVELSYPAHRDAIIRRERTLQENLLITCCSEVHINMYSKIGFLSTGTLFYL